MKIGQKLPKAPYYTAMGPGGGEERQVKSFVSQNLMLGQVHKQPP
jgi:hypothetical protein